MPKAERGTPKDIANRMKAKGLQKLKFYCQMCHKQCRDENGFKCHLTSDSHLRQMKIFSENAGGMLDEFSKEFESMYLETLRRRHGTKKMNANNVYQEVIQDRHHVHMNSTKWAALSDFVQYLGKTGKCVVEETERGWYVSYIERDAGLLARQEAQRRRVEAERLNEQKFVKRMQVQRVEAAKALDRAGGSVQTEASKVDGVMATNVKMAISSAGKSQKTKVVESISVFGKDDEEEEEEDTNSKQEISSGVDGSSSRLPAAKETKNPDRDRKRPRHPNAASAPESKRPRKDSDRKENWLHRDIIVRIISKELAKGKYYKRKGVVDRLLDKFTAEVELLDSSHDAKHGGDIIRIDQDDLETVVPKEVSKKVLVVNGSGRGQVAKVLSLDKDRYLATLKLLDDGRVLEKVDYEDFSKLA